MTRLLDIVFSGSALLILSPLLLLIMLILRVTGEGEIFFVQSRIGLNGKHFGLYKFATMLKNSPNIGAGTVTLKDDPRVLPVGRLLRTTKINELPQLLNILFGDMSIIGPRPQTQRCFEAFSEAAQAEIKKVRPGLSGVGSIVFRGEEDMLEATTDYDQFYNNVIMSYKGRLESWFVDNNTVGNYLLLIALTVLVITTRSTRYVFRCYSSLPRPPLELTSFIDSESDE